MSNKHDGAELKEEFQAYLERLAPRETNIVCRDRQYDEQHSAWFLLKAFAVGVLPVIAGIALYWAISASANHRIQPGTWQAFASLAAVVGASLGAVLGIRQYGKRHCVGNKFLYYVISNQGLFFTHLGLGPVSSVIREGVRGMEKVRSLPLWVYAMVFLLDGHGLIYARRFARAESFFRLNQTYHVAEKLLSSEGYGVYCTKVVGVTKINEHAHGCEVTWKQLRNGVEETETQTIHRNTEHYGELMAAFRQRLICEENGVLLSREESRQVYGIILRRMAALLLGALIIAIVAVESYRLFLVNTDKAQQLSSGWMRWARSFLANRAERRSIRGAYGLLALVMLPLGKLIADAVQVNKLTAMPIQVRRYVKPRRPFYREMLSEFHYYAQVEWKGETVSVGMSKVMWKHREGAEPLLVLRKGMPYCVVNRGKIET